MGWRIFPAQPTWPPGGAVRIRIRRNLAKCLAQPRGHADVASALHLLQQDRHGRASTRQTQPKRRPFRENAANFDSMTTMLAAELPLTTCCLFPLKRNPVRTLLTIVRIFIAVRDNLSGRLLNLVGHGGSRLARARCCRLRRDYGRSRCDMTQRKPALRDAEVGTMKLEKLNSEYWPYEDGWEVAREDHLGREDRAHARQQRIPAHAARKATWKSRRVAKNSAKLPAGCADRRLKRIG